MKNIRYVMGVSLALASLGSQSLLAHSPNEGERVRPFVAHMMAQMDVDNNGVITRDEFRAPVRERANRASWQAADGDQNGELTRAEVEAHLNKELNGRMEQGLARFDRADHNGDGVITAQERHAALFDRMDRNGDGELSGDELAPRRLRRARIRD